MTNDSCNAVAVAATKVNSTQFAMGAPKTDGDSVDQLEHTESSEILMDDVLEPIPVQDLDGMREFYTQYLPYTTHVVSLLTTAIRWGQQYPNKEYLTIMAINGDWTRDGSIVVLIQFSCYDLFVFTLEKSCCRLYKALRETRRIDWRRNVLFYGVLVEHSQSIRRLIRDLQLPVNKITKIDIWWMRKEEALAMDIDCPPEVYIEALSTSHVPAINAIWPHRFPGSEGYLSTLIDLNGGYGVFLRETGDLIAWVLRTHLGALGILQTVAQYKRRGYGSLVTRALSKVIAEDGQSPIGTVVIDNVPSQNMFRGLGYDILHTCEFIQLDSRLPSSSDAFVR